MVAVVMISSCACRRPPFVIWFLDEVFIAKRKLSMGRGRFAASGLQLQEVGDFGD
jgi:hypothetical protein